MQSPIANIVNKYLKLSNFSIDSKTFELQVETHPDYPSLKSISDTFDYFGIENLIAKVPKEAFDQLPNSFIALLIKDNDSKLILTEKKKNGILITEENLTKQKISVEAFKKNWDGTIIAIEDNKQHNDISESFNFKKIGVLVFGLIILMNILNSNTIEIISYNLLSLIGLLISYFIVKESFGIHNKAVAKVCETISKKDGCKTVINDKQSAIFSRIPLSDAAIIYFLISVLSSVITGFNVPLLFCVSLCSIPFVLFTLYYQGFVLKQWCALCLGVSLTLIFQFLVLTASFQGFYFDFTILMKYLFTIFLVVIVWHNLKLLWIKNSKLAAIEIDFLKFKRNKELFDNLLKKEKLINNNLITTENKIVFGSDNPVLTINAVTNPFCGYCAESFRTYYNLLNTRKGVDVNLVFSVPNDIKKQEMQIVVTIIKIYLKGNKREALESLKDWYSDRNIKNWESKYGLAKSINEEVFSLLKNQQNWLQVNNIKHTPATFIGDYYFPKSYNIEDLSMFIDDMILDKQNLVLLETI
ncbi:vitamin K epoxide reductase family protein [Flavobacterium sp. GT3R68]|uniref:vitamin K epoxide reductase family protein n=1 Tax=Flavobacterium sp. GT3R68 TaxID=2594437 RepID=UPI0013158427|nr:vitamin K epoxide reductase family protein [Flavobacterium sp. GT3R68]